jgi:DNA invertase Pin-like site-specific DNA recombinase
VTKSAIAYLRKSRVIRDQKVISFEMQLAEVRELAARQGYDPGKLTVLQDSNISGRKGRAKRAGYNTLLTMIEDGEASALFSYSLSRLSRRVADIIPLVELCAAQGVPIHLARDVSPDPTTASGRLMLAMLAAMAQFESDVTSERMTDIAEFRRLRGDKLGGAFFGDATKVRDAFLEAGTLAGAARLLKRWRVKTRNGLSVWSATSVKGILAREFPEVAPANPSRGAKSFAPYWFYRMVVCHCGRIMTGRRDRKRNTAYICLAGRLDPDHGKSHMPEPRIKTAVVEELRHFHFPFDAVAEEETAESRQRLIDLRARRERVGWAAVDGMIERDQANAEIVVIDDEISKLELAGQMHAIKAEVDWAETEGTNGILRRLFERIEITPEMTVKRLEWTEPLFRSEQPVVAA